MSYELQAQLTEEWGAEWYRTVRDVAARIGAKVIPMDRDAFEIELPDGWTHEMFTAEVERTWGESAHGRVTGSVPNVQVLPRWFKTKP